MTTPYAKPDTSLSGVWGELATLPRWALVGIVTGAGLLAWWLLKGVGSANTPTINQTWSNNAVTYLTQQGYPQAQAQSAVNAYSSGQQLTQQQVSLVSDAVAAVGTPDMPTNTSPVVPSGSGATTAPTVSTNSASGVWKVTSMGVGWTSTFRGIAQQFYGDPSDSTYISAVNPGVTPSDFSMIPAGTVVSVPRSLTS